MSNHNSYIIRSGSDVGNEGISPQTSWSPVDPYQDPAPHFQGGDSSIEMHYPREQPLPRIEYHNQTHTHTFPGTHPLTLPTAPPPPPQYHLQAPTYPPSAHVTFTADTHNPEEGYVSAPLRRRRKSRSRRSWCWIVRQDLRDKFWLILFFLLFVASAVGNFVILPYLLVCREELRALRNPNAVMPVGRPEGMGRWEVGGGREVGDWSYGERFWVLNA